MSGIVRQMLRISLVALILAGMPASARPSSEGGSAPSAVVSNGDSHSVESQWPQLLVAGKTASKDSAGHFLLASSPVALTGAGAELDQKTDSMLTQVQVFDPSELTRLSMKSHPKASPGTAIPAGQSDRWEIILTPYLFMASQKGLAGMGGHQVAVDARFADIIDELNFGFMGAFEAHKGKFVTFIDFEYMNVSDSKATPGPLFTDAQVRLKTYIFDPEFGYRLVGNKKGSLDALAGIRYMHIGSKFDLHPGLLPTVTVEDGNGWADPVIGLKGRVNLSPRWHLEAKGDLGGFGVGSHFTWQFFGGLGADVGKRGYLVFGYRYMDVDYSKNGFLFDMATRGPLIGFGLKF